MVRAKPILAMLALAATTMASPIAQPLNLPSLFSNTTQRANATEEAMERAKQIQEEKCKKKFELQPFEPKSWAESGAEKYLGDYLDKNGPVEWLQEISSDEEGRPVAVDCGDISSNNCAAPESPEKCEDMEYYFVRVMASQINSAFRSLQKNLQDTAIEDGLKIEKIIQDFDVLQPPQGQKMSDTLNNMAIGTSVLSTIFGFFPGGGAVASGIFSVLGTAFSTAAEHVDKEPPPMPEYKDLKPVLAERLGGFFIETRTRLDEVLLAIFGDTSKHTEAESTKLVREMVSQMGGMGVKNLNKDAKSPINELLKGGEWLRTAQTSTVNDAMKKTFATVRQGLVGNLLASLQVYVEQEMPAWNEGLVQPCTALGTLKEGNSCYVIKTRPWNGASDGVAAKPLESKYLELMGDYGIDLHTLIRNVRDCNNGQAQKTPADLSKIPTGGSLPACFFGMNFAQRAHSKDVSFAKSVGSSCISSYINQKGVPGWIIDNKGHCDNEIPRWKNCKVTFEETSYWTEGGLDRYRMGMVGDNIDMGPVCPYAYDGRRCAFASNRQCYFNKELNKWVFDVNFPKGSHGHGKYKECRDDIRKKYAEDNRCSYN
ncbi:hypothetical protein DM02DRAFT_726727 [Periconia macrospinosa]|uniref:Uncharacterized protein n=1 Tax=Periconia macrospinosa TaxID=97972 RepID=A0A2V1E1Q4_9PLEO|nr:hypothetical protein DM02DRAFT_726727 [Periconia macrospinosa]